MFEALDASGDVYDTVPYKAVQKTMRALPFDPQAGEEMYLGYKAIESELLVIEDLDATAGQLGLSAGNLRAKPHSYVDRFGDYKAPFFVAADALQLAAAYRWAAERPQGYEFVSLDGTLRRAAEAEGFTVVPGEETSEESAAEVAKGS